MSGRAGSGPARPAWFWIATGVLQGAVLTFALVPVWESNHRLDVVLVFGGFAFVLSGMLLGYRSPSRTVKDALVGGTLLTLLVAAGLGVLGFRFGGRVWIAGSLCGLALSSIGGWTGLQLRRAVDERDPDDRRVSWPWVAVGTVLGVVLNGSAAFVVSALFDLWGAALAMSFAASFFVTGAFVGYHAPGHSPRDSAVVGLGVVAVDTVLVMGVFSVPFPLPAVVMADAIGFALVLAGGWTGDLAWQLRTRIARVHPDRQR